MSGFHCPKCGATMNMYRQTEMGLYHCADPNCDYRPSLLEQIMLDIHREMHDVVRFVMEYYAQRGEKNGKSKS